MNKFNFKCQHCNFKTNDVTIETFDDEFHFVLRIKDNFNIKLDEYNENKNYLVNAFLKGFTSDNEELEIHKTTQLFLTNITDPIFIACVEYKKQNQKICQNKNPQIKRKKIKKISYIDHSDYLDFHSMKHVNGIQDDDFYLSLSYSRSNK